LRIADWEKIADCGLRIADWGLGEDCGLRIADWGLETNRGGAEFSEKKVVNP
jgi:hypothetical protein